MIWFFESSLHHPIKYTGRDDFGIILWFLWLATRTLVKKKWFGTPANYLALLFLRMAKEVTVITDFLIQAASIERNQ